MAAILLIATGTLGLLVAFASLAFGASLLTALALWPATGLALSALALAYSARPRQTAPALRA